MMRMDQLISIEGDRFEWKLENFGGVMSKWIMDKMTLIEFIEVCKIPNFRF